MNPMLLFAAVAGLRKSASEAIRRTVLDASGYALQVFCSLVISGFLTAAFFLWLTETRSAIAACIIIAALYAVLVVVISVVMMLVKNRRHQPMMPNLAASSLLDSSTMSTRTRFPGGIVSVGLLVVAGYLMGRSIMNKR